MESQLKNQMKELRLLGRMDEEYKAHEKRFAELESQLEKMAAELTREQQDLLWDYICTSDAMDHRLLEIACKRIDWKGLNK